MTHRADNGFDWPAIRESVKAEVPPAFRVAVEHTDAGVIFSIPYKVMVSKEDFAASEDAVRKAAKAALWQAMVFGDVKAA